MYNYTSLFTNDILPVSMCFSGSKVFVQRSVAQTTRVPLVAVYDRFVRKTPPSFEFVTTFEIHPVGAQAPDAPRS